MNALLSLEKDLEELREKHEQGLVTSIECLKHLLILAHDVAEAEKEVVPEPEINKAVAALTELFNGIEIFSNTGGNNWISDKLSRLRQLAIKRFKMINNCFWWFSNVS